MKGARTTAVKASAPRKPRDRAPWAAYGPAKAPVDGAGLAPTDYARAVRRLARKMGL